MVLWNFIIKYKNRKTEDLGIRQLAVPAEAKQPQQEWDNLLRELNIKHLGAKCDPEGKISVYICNGKPGSLEAIMANSMESASLEQCFSYIKKTLEENYAVRNVNFSEAEEITGEKFDSLGDRACENGYIRRWYAERQNLRVDYFSNSTFKVEEHLVMTHYSSKEEALEAAGDILADQSFIEELDRIYSDENEKKYYGNPVHYRLSVSDAKIGMEMVDVLVPALFANKRLYGRRILRIHNITENCFEEKDLDNLFSSAQGNALVLEMSGADGEFRNFANAYHRVVEYIDSVVAKYHINTLCFFLEVKDQAGFSKSLLAKAAETLRFVNLHEGYGDRSRAKMYLKKLTEKETFRVTDREIDEALGEKKMFSVEEIHSIYDNWFKDSLCRYIYKSYAHYNFGVAKNDEPCSEPYMDLQKMIGLTQIKGIVDEVLSTAKIRKMRNSMDLTVNKASLHMVFTGNPGTAKTTVARLIAQILRKEDILEGGHLVECGRADLIAKYVGWTARQVRSKFREAKGGILFIDEAYSLVDDSHSFADEAINTIVQEMENNRDQVIVIFAGYPGKMEAFLNKNEGLRSRIAFHLNFPDYTPDEMIEILKLMAEQHGYHLCKDVFPKCKEIFEKACSQEDFGNGRFVRNLLEQAEMAQSHRIALQYNGKKMSKKVLLSLHAADFDVNISNRVKPQANPFGFS